MAGGVRWQYNHWYDLPDIGTSFDFNTIRAVVYDINPQPCWPQYGAEARNCFFTEYDAPETTHNENGERIPTTTARGSFWASETSFS